MKRYVRNLLGLVPYVRRLQKHFESFNRSSCFPPGHYYSPLVDVDEIKEQEGFIWPLGIERHSGIDLNIEEQRELIRQFQKYYDEFPFAALGGNGFRYHYRNGYYGFTDAFLLYCFLRHYKPKRVIEVGSGFSSAVMLDTRDHYLPTLDMTFIEPFPDRLYSLLKESDRASSKIEITKLQAVPLSTFAKLDRGDILFIDSTHVSKTGSDVNYIFFQILPLLKSGVLIHFHDIFYPFEYPREWVFEGRNWNENYLLRAFLMYNPNFTIRMFSHYLINHHPNVFELLPLCVSDAGGSLWLEKN